MGEGDKVGEAVNTKPSYYLMQSIITLFSGGCWGLGEGGKAGEAVNTKPSYYLMQSIITLFSGVLGIGGGG